MSRTSMTHAEYVAAERVAAIRHEYLRGQVWAMAGGTIEHGRLSQRPPTIYFDPTAPA